MANLVNKKIKIGELIKKDTKKKDKKKQSWLDKLILKIKK